MKFLLLILKNLGRNRLRTLLTALAVICLVAIFSMLATVLRFLERAMAQKDADVPVVMTERYRIPSRFDSHYFYDVTQPGTLNSKLGQIPGFHADQHTLWHFVGFTLDPDMKDKNLQFFVIATIPEKIPSMVDGLEEFDPKLCALLKKPPRSQNAGILMGPVRLQKINKKVGDQFKAYSISHRKRVAGGRRPIEMELEIVGELPADSRWTESAFMDHDYLDRTLKAEDSELYGKINLGWFKLDDQDSAGKFSGAIEEYTADVKCETASSAVSRFLEPYKGLLKGIKYLLAPAILIVMTLIVANAIGITVRERTAEMAVLKVLGFRPVQILALVLGEGLLIGLLGGLAGAGITYGCVNYLWAGIKIPFGFFPVFFVPVHVFWWGPALGALTAFLGGIVPAWNARSIKVSEVFAKVA